MKITFSTILHNIDRNYLKTVIKESFCFSDDSFKELRKLIPNEVKVSGFTSAKKVPFSSCLMLSKAISSSIYYAEPNLSRLILKFWTQKNKKIVQEVLTSLHELGYEADFPNFNYKDLVVNTLKPSDVFKSEEGNVYFQPNGQQIGSLSNEMATVAAAILGWIPLSLDNLQVINDDVSISEDHSNSEPIIEAEKTPVVHISDTTSTEQTLNDSSSAQLNEIHTNQSLSNLEPLANNSNPELDVNQSLEHQVLKTSSLVFSDSMPDSEKLSLLEELFETESDFYKLLASNLAIGILPDISILSDRLQFINQHITAFADSVGYPQGIESVSLSDLKLFFNQEFSRKQKYQKDRIIVAKTLQKTLAIHHRKQTVFLAIDQIKQLADQYLSLLDDISCDQSDWFKLLIAESHFLNLLIKCIELRDTTDHDENILDALLGELRACFPHDQFNSFNIIETQINRGNLFISAFESPDPIVVNENSERVAKNNDEFHNTEIPAEKLDESSESIRNFSINESKEQPGISTDLSAINNTETDSLPETSSEPDLTSSTKTTSNTIPVINAPLNEKNSYANAKQPQAEINTYDKYTLELLKANEPELAYHLVKCYESLGIDSMLPSYLLENLILAPHIQSANGPMAQKMEPNILQYDFIQDKSDKSQLINHLAFASILRPCFFAYDSIGAGLILQDLHSGKLSEFSELKKLISEFMLQPNTTMIYERINQIKGHEKISDLRHDFLARLEEWLEKAQLARYRKQPKNFHSMVFNAWVKPEGWIYAFLDSLLANPNSTAIQNFIENELDESSWLKKYKKDLKTIAGNQKSLFDNTEAKRWVENYIEELKILLESGISLLNETDTIFDSKEENAILSLVEKIMTEFSRIKNLLFKIHNENIFNEIGYLFISKAINNVENILNGDSKVENLKPTYQILNWPLLKLDYYESDDFWQPVEYNHILRDQLIGSLPSLSSDLYSIANKHIQHGNFEALNRLFSLNIIDENSLINKNIPDSFLDKLIFESNRVRIEIERGCAFGYILNGHRESYIAKIDAVGANGILSSSDLNFPLRKSKIDAVFNDIQLLKNSLILETKTKYLKSADPEFHADLIEMIDKGNLLVFNDSIERIKKGTYVPLDDKKILFDDFYNGFLANETGRDNAVVVKALQSRTALNNLDFSNITEFQALDAVDLISSWQSLKRFSFDEKLAFDKLLPFFDFLGFNSVINEGSKKFKKAFYLDISCSPITGRANTPLPQFGSFAKGKYRIICFLSNITEEDLVDTVRELIPTTNRAVIVFGFFWMDHRFRLELTKLNKRDRLTALVLDEALLYFLFSQRNNKFSTFVRLSAPFTFAEPYQTASSNLPEEMFYGRQPQIQKLKNIIGDFSCLIYGGRQLGKTVLQREVERIFNQPDINYFAIYFDLRNSGLGVWRPLDDFAEVLMESFLSIPGLIPEKRNPNAGLQYLISKIKEWTDNYPDGRIILFLDESDKFLEKDSLLEWPNVLPLKGLMEKTEKRFKVVFAGLHDVRRTIKIPNNPLAHFGNPICVGPMLEKEEIEEAQLLITLPLETLGATFESDDLIYTILSHCNWYPSLIQIFCSKLISILNEKKHLRTLPIVINANDISLAYERSREIIKEKFNLTISLDERYNLLANIIASESIQNHDLLSQGIGLERIANLALDYWPEGFDNSNPKVEVKFLLEEMADLGILRIEPNGKTALRTPNLLALIGDERQVNDNLEYKKRSLPSEFNRETSRIIYNRGNRELRSPFPAIYYDKLIEYDSKVTIIKGSPMGGLNTVVEFLKTRKKDFNLIIPDAFDENDDDFWKSIEKKRVTNKHTLILFAEQKKFFFEDVNRIIGLIANKSSVSAAFLINPDNLLDIILKNDNTFQRLENLKVDIFNIPQWKIDVASEWFRETGCITADVNLIFENLSNWDKILNDYHELISESPENWSEKLHLFKKNLLLNSNSLLIDLGLINDDIISVVKYLIEWDGSLSSEEFISDVSQGKSSTYNMNVLEYLTSLNIIDKNLIVNSLVKYILNNG